MEQVPTGEPLMLRGAMLSGRFTRLGSEAVAQQFAAFLTADRAALTAWFGEPLAAELRRDPARCRGLLDRDLAVIDTLIAAQLDAVLHHPRLQRLEGSWRGLAWLVDGIRPDTHLRVRLLSASWRELDRDFARATEFDQSALFRLLYENEFGSPGGEPFGLLIIDHEIKHRPDRRGVSELSPVDDISVLDGIAAIAAAAFMPVVVAAAPMLLGADRFEDLTGAQDIAAVLADNEHARWRQLAQSENARFLCVTVPRVLARPRWEPDPGRTDGLLYDEYAPRAADRTWSVACYAFAATVARAQAEFGWPADVRGVETDRIGGGLVLDLPAEDFAVGAATVWPRPSLDLALTDRQERELVLSGLMPLNTLPYGDAAFAAVHSLQARVSDAVGREPTGAVANTRLSAQINTMLCVSRFAHMLKVIGRELTGSFKTADEIERRLQRWLADYTNATPGADAESRARRPLVSSHVSVHELPGRPGAFGCVIHLQPFYQLDDVSAAFRLVTGFANPSEATRAA
jgi:type VI secretion system ImpC/EvpB family protein